MKSENSKTLVQEFYNNHRGGIVMGQNINGGIEFFFDGFNNSEEAKAEILAMYDDKPAMKEWMNTFINQGSWEHV